jgi:septal ring factor EnvC (AmiA/AmiB activator)
LQTKLDALQQQLAATQSELQEVRGDASSIRSRLKPLMRQLLEAGAAKNRATAALEDAQVGLKCMPVSKVDPGHWLSESHGYILV